MRLINIFSAACAAIVLVTFANLPAEAANPVLATVKARGQLLCGVNGQSPGFSSLNDKKEWVGFEVDFCRSVAAATLGDATKVKIVPVNAGKRFDVLRSGEIDVLARLTTTTVERTARTGVRDAAVIYIDGQAVAVPKKLGISKLEQVAGYTVCILNGTRYERNIQDWFKFRNLAYKPRTFDTEDKQYAAFFAGECDALVQDISSLSTAIVASRKAVDYLVLPEIIDRDPLAVYVRAGDDEWFDVVRWTFNALLDAEERGVTQANVEEQLRTGTPWVKRLLGTPPEDAKLLGLDDKWAFNIVKQVGNYSEIYERNLGQGSTWKFPRAINALWNNGGVLHALPLR